MDPHYLNMLNDCLAVSNVFLCFTESKSQSNMLNHVSSSLLVNSLPTSNNTSVVNSVSANSIGNPSIPPAPLINNLLTNNCVTESNTPSSASATNNSSVITSLSVSSTTSSQANVVNSISDSSKVDVTLPMVMNGPTSAGGSFHQVSHLGSLFIKFLDFRQIFSEPQQLLPRGEKHTHTHTHTHTQNKTKQNKTKKKNRIFLFKNNFHNFSGRDCRKKYIKLDLGLNS